MIRSVRFWGAWGAATAAMLTISFYWHFKLLNDAALLTFDVDSLLIMALVGYGLLAGFMTYCFARFRGLVRKKNVLPVGIAGGLLAFLFLRLSTPFGPEQDEVVWIIDLLWQVTEQTFGALIIATVYRLKFYIRRAAMLFA